MHSDSNASEYDDDVEDQGAFNLILIAFPKLRNNIQGLIECPSTVQTLADFVRPLLPVYLRSLMCFYPDYQNQLKGSQRRSCSCQQAHRRST